MFCVTILFAGSSFHALDKLSRQVELDRQIATDLEKQIRQSGKQIEETQQLLEKERSSDKGKELERWRQRLDQLSQIVSRP